MSRLFWPRSKVNHLRGLILYDYTAIGHITTLKGYGFTYGPQLNSCCCYQSKPSKTFHFLSILFFFTTLQVTSKATSTNDLDLTSSSLLTHSPNTLTNNPLPHPTYLQPLPKCERVQLYLSVEDRLTTDIVKVFVQKHTKVYYFVCLL